MTKSAKIRRLLSKNTKPVEIAKKLKVNPNLVYQVAWHAKKKKKPSKIVKAVKEMKQALDVMEKPKITRKELLNELMPGLDACFGLDKKAPPSDPVNHPPHYKAGGIETLDFIEAKDLNFRLGNVVKYVSRAGKKVDSDPVQDLEKAAFYLKREIEARKNA